MSILQSKESELRYMKRKNLEHEARMIGNQYRDIIRSYGIDCVYHKRDTTVFENYNATIDQNILLERAYGYDIAPDYTCSANMITYVDVEKDVFQLQKLGMNSDSDLNLYFDSLDFACALATKSGQYKEYKIKETFIDCEVPECTNEIRNLYSPVTNEFVMSSYISSDVFPYNLGLGYNESYNCGILSGKLSVSIPGYELNVEQTIICDPYEHSDFEVIFPTNTDLYETFKRRICNDDYLQTLIFLTFKVSTMPTGELDEIGQPIMKNILHGKIHGGVLFYDVNKIGKYLDKIHPEVGDIVTIDYPNKESPERYEITDCYDKSLQTDGISPLLHNYIWKCKGRRYINNSDEFPETVADEKRNEKIQLEKVIDDKVAKSISGYKDGEDAVYGGYDLDDKDKVYDTQTIDVENKRDRYTYDYIEDGTAIDIYHFTAGSKLVTTGYEILFVTSNDQACKLTVEDHPLTVKDAYFEEGLRFIKASKDCLAFTNIEGTTFKIVEDEEATKGQLEVCLNSLFDKTLDPNSTKTTDGNNFYVFKESKTLLWATSDSLFCRLASNGRLYKLV